VPDGFQLPGAAASVTPRRGVPAIAGAVVFVGTAAPTGPTAGAVAGVDPVALVAVTTARSALPVSPAATV
jgi:hypothetical protein